MNKTGIEYLDCALNLFVGCSGIGCSVGLDRCWAARVAKRLKNRCQLCYEFTPHYHKERWPLPFQEKRARIIGLNFMGETFDAQNLEEHRYELKEMMWMVERCSWHTFVLLTKHPENIPRALYLPDNLWLGVTVNQKADLHRLETLLQRPGSFVPVLSAEPLYGCLGQLPFSNEESHQRLGWIIIGSQTKPFYQPDDAPFWAYDMIAQAQRQKVPVFIKNNMKNLAPCACLKEKPQQRVVRPRTSRAPLFPVEMNE